MKKPTALEVHAELRDCDDHHWEVLPLNSWSCNELVAKVAEAAREDGAHLRRKLKPYELGPRDVLSWLMGEPAFLLAAHVGPEVLRFYATEFMREAFSNQPINLREFAAELVCHYYRHQSRQLNAELLTFKQDAREHAARAWMQHC